MEKPYKLGITVGRFQTFHKGHQQMLDTALALCDRVGVLIGSSQESGTSKNPFSYAMRKRLLQTVYGERITVCPLPDIGVGNNAAWGDYVLARAAECFGEKPDLLISGKETRRTNWLDGERGLSVAELYVPKTIDISASEMRELLLRDRFDLWKEYCDERLWDCFPEMRKTVLETHENLITASL